MALKPTIFKLRIDLADMDRNRFEAVPLTVALHPSETIERMLVRILAFCIHVEDGLEFTKGLSEANEPDLWLRTPDDRIALWIDVGEPSEDRIRKASRQADRTIIYSFNSKSEVWWRNEGAALSRHPAEFFRVLWEDVQALAPLVQRTMDIAVTLSGGSAYFATADGDREVRWEAIEAP
ncbi:MAG: YaeQ family protein [Pseudomonadota bacterium]